jgi:MscS family membrane protein
VDRLLRPLAAGQLAILLWTGALIRIASAVLRHTATARPGTVVQPRTIPLFEMLAKILLFSAAVYLIMVAWALDVTGWLASAGIVGIAVGFAAKDSLANLFAGIFIIADAPYKLGDFIMFEDGLRGRVTDIGLRATRILTRDDIEINIPNQVIGNSRVVNETGGPHEQERVQIKVSAAYGADIDLVRQVLLECPKGQPDVCESPRPHVQLPKVRRLRPRVRPLRVDPATPASRRTSSTSSTPASTRPSPPPTSRSPTRSKTSTSGRPSHRPISAEIYD